MGQGQGMPMERKPIDVRPDILEKLASCLDIARVPIQLNGKASPAADSGTFLPLDKRDVMPVGTLKKHTGAPVTLHVYDLDFYGIDSSMISKFAGVPIYHLGVEIYQLEFCFGVDGIISLWPGNYDVQRHRKAEALGMTTLTNRQVLDVLNDLTEQWDGSAYRLLGKNCQTFANEFCKRLGLHDGCIDPEYMRFADGLSLAARRKAGEAQGGSAVQQAAHQNAKAIAKIRL
mmetsp:Transcript_58512/g.148495  ORF Transcript_58512/g.148495 Transcript_58512/m.148495 type:complete len:231 (+) Transcript_58512:37-729(+)